MGENLHITVFGEEKLFHEIEEFLKEKGHTDSEVEYKEAEETKILLCKGGLCYPPADNLEAAKEEIQKLLEEEKA